MIPGCLYLWCSFSCKIYVGHTIQKGILFVWSKVYTRLKFAFSRCKNHVLLRWISLPSVQWSTGKPYARSFRRIPRIQDSSGQLHVRPNRSKCSEFGWKMECLSVYSHLLIPQNRSCSFKIHFSSVQFVLCPTTSLLKIRLEVEGHEMSLHL